MGGSGLSGKNNGLLLMKQNQIESDSVDEKQYLVFVFNEEAVEVEVSTDESREQGLKLIPDKFWFCSWFTAVQNGNWSAMRAEMTGKIGAWAHGNIMGSFGCRRNSQLNVDFIGTHVGIQKKAIYFILISRYCEWIKSTFSPPKSLLLIRWMCRNDMNFHKMVTSTSEGSLHFKLDGIISHLHSSK
jgi:hypothetical protein